MSELIKLKVPSKPAAEFVSHGNHEAELTPKAVITVTDRRFANFLVNEYGLAEVEESAAGAGAAAVAGAAAEEDNGGNK